MIVRPNLFSFFCFFRRVLGLICGLHAFVCKSGDELNGVDDSCHASSLLQVGLRMESTRTPSAANLCMDGRLVPELYVIGAMKSGTTSLVDELVRSKQFVMQRPQTERNQFDMIRIPPGDSWIAFDEVGFQSEKEPHFFDWRYKRPGHDKQAWLSLWPKCQNKARQVAADCTDQMHFTVVPSRISAFYGHLQSRLKFAVVLRNPLERLQSEFFFLKGNILRDRENGIITPSLEHALPTFVTMGFPEYIQKIVQEAPTCHQVDDPSQARTDPFCDSHYADQLAKWFSHFDSTQFRIYPMKSITMMKPGEPSVAESLWADLGIEGHRIAKPVHANAGEHGTLLDDLGGNSTLLNEITRLLEKRAGADKVAKVLTSYSPYLHDCAGDSSDGNAVAKWLSDNW